MKMRGRRNHNMSFKSGGRSGGGKETKKEKSNLDEKTLHFPIANCLESVRILKKAHHFKVSPGRRNISTDK
jgi:hypothetical protein